MDKTHVTGCGEAIAPTRIHVGASAKGAVPCEQYEAHTQMPDVSAIFHMDTLPDESTAGINWHENIELIFMRGGTANVLCNAELYSAEPGDVFVFSSLYIHQMISKNSPVYDVLIIDRNFCRLAGLDTDAVVFEPRIRDGELVRLHRAAVAEVSRQPDAFQVLAARGAILSLVAYLCRHYSRPASAASSRSENGVRHAIRYMREHLSENLTVEKLAAVAGFSKYHFLREFKRYTSYTVITYLNIVRVERAKTLLVGGASVSEAALACGFGNFSYFSKVFRAYVGTSPMDYVKREVGKANGQAENA